MSERGESTIKIHDFQWEAFWEWCDNFEETCSEKERNFVQNFLQDDNTCKVWIQTYRNCLSEALGFSSRGTVVNIKTYNLSR